uniref:Uncharacterized protein n=1 Tax=Panagrolaimus superbus TaxID=310955 RepID=A0A914Z8H0_9BILA
MNSPTAIFDSQNPKYKCCFGKVHVKTATKWICVLYFILAILFVCFLGLEDLEFSWILFFAILIGSSIDCFIFGSGFYAVKKEKPKWLFPFLLAFVLSLFFDGYCIGYDLINKSYEDAWIIFDIVDFILSIWIINVVYNCYQYLIAKNQSGCLPMSFSNKTIIIPFSLEEETV